MSCFPLIFIRMVVGFCLRTTTKEMRYKRNRVHSTSEWSRSARVLVDKEMGEEKYPLDTEVTLDYFRSSVTLVNRVKKMRGEKQKKGKGNRTKKGIFITLGVLRNLFHVRCLR